MQLFTNQWWDLPFLDETHHIPADRASHTLPCLVFSPHTSWSLCGRCWGTAVLLLSWATHPPGQCWYWFLSSIAVESFHFSFCNCCLLGCREYNTVYNIIYCNWLYNLRIKIAPHCARIKCSHWLAVISPSRIIHEEYINVWFLISMGTIFQILWKSLR